MTQKKVKKKSHDKWIIFSCHFFSSTKREEKRGKILEKRGKKNVSFPHCVRNCALGRMMVIVLLSSLPQHSFCWRTTIGRRWWKSWKYSSKANWASIRWKSPFEGNSHALSQSGVTTLRSVKWPEKENEELSQATIWLCWRPGVKNREIPENVYFLTCFFNLLKIKAI